MQGSTVVVTGANSGIGKETAVALAAMGARVVVTARDAAKGAAALDEIRRRSGSGTVDLVALDLGSFASVRACGAQLLDTYERIDVLVNNAGGILRSRRVTEDGHETQFQVNHLGPFLLTNLLRDRLVEGAPARVVTVASGAHSFAGGIDLDDLDATRRYRGFRTYARTKLMNILFTRELARRLAGTGVTANAVHPGLVATNFSREGDTALMGTVGMLLARPFARSPEQGARTSVYVASSTELEGVSGRYFVSGKAATPSAAARDDTTARRLWEISAALTGAGA